MDCSQIKNLNIFKCFLVRVLLPLLFSPDLCLYLHSLYACFCLLAESVFLPASCNCQRITTIGVNRHSRVSFQSYSFFYFVLQVKFLFCFVFKASCFACKRMYPNILRASFSDERTDCFHVFLKCVPIRSYIIKNQLFHSNVAPFIVS